jgi:hypothetical protein
LLLLLQDVRVGHNKWDGGAPQKTRKKKQAEE